MSKRVAITLRMDSEFVLSLNLNVQLSQLAEKDELQPIDQLALLVLAEARGMHEEQVHGVVLPMWRPHIEAISESRKVEQ